MENITIKDEVQTKNEDTKIIEEIEVKQDGSVLDETMTTTKGFRITVATKKRIAKIEKATELSGDELLSQLLDSYDMLNVEEKEITDEYEELKSILSRIQSIFINSREKQSTQSTIVISRLKETIRNLSSQVEALTTELLNTQKYNKQETENMKNSYLLDIAKLEKQLNEKDDKVKQLESKIIQCEKQNDTYVKTQKELEEQLSKSLKENSKNSDMLTEKDLIIRNVNEQMSKCNEELTYERNERNDLFKENLELNNTIDKYKQKLENMSELKDEQKKLYEETILMYKNSVLEKEKKE